MPNPVQSKILFLSASPASQQPLALDEEVRLVKKRIRECEFRDSISFVTEWAVRPDDLQDALLRHRPHVVHFSGHGSSQNEVLLVGEDGQEVPVGTETLRLLFRILKDNIQLVVFNACFAEVQAQAVVQHVNCAIGMNDAITDDAARIFSASLYRALGFGRTVQEAFELGLFAIKAENLQEESIPQLLEREEGIAAKIRIVEPDETAIDESTSQQSGDIVIGGNASGNVNITGSGNTVNVDKKK